MKKITQSGGGMSEGGVKKITSGVNIQENSAEVSGSFRTNKEVGLGVSDFLKVK